MTLSALSFDKCRSWRKFALHLFMIGPANPKNRFPSAFFPTLFVVACSVLTAMHGDNDCIDYVAAA